MSRYLDELAGRVLVFDGAMGTSIQARGLTAADFGGPRWEGCNDVLVRTRPDVIEEIHASFLEVGCDVVETNTFRANRLTLREYGLERDVAELNRTAAALARRVADRFSTPERPRFVAGSLGPSGFLPSTSDPVLGQISFAELVDAFAEQARALIEGGVDVLLIETGQDLLEMKAAVFGCRRARAETRRDVAIQAQVTLDLSGRMLLGTDPLAALTVLEALRVDVVGLNCSTGPDAMRGPVRLLLEHATRPISVLPNAGIPHNEGGRAVYPLEPEPFAEQLEEFVRWGVAVVGGCCGTTPEHLAALVARVHDRPRTPRAVVPVPRLASAIRAIDLVQEPRPTQVGERLNAQGSRKVKQLLLSGDEEGLVDIAREQVDRGAHVLDVCVALTERSDEPETLRRVVKLLSQSVEAPLCLDSTEPAALQAALEQCPGRPIVNSINFENGRERADVVLPLVRDHGAAVVALTIDRDIGGMAKTAEQKLAVARKAVRLAVEEYGLAPEDVIIDPLTFTLATGDEEYRRSAVETLEALRRIKAELPGVKTILGVSNVSFGLAPHARAVLNSVFLHHAVQAGLDLAIVNPAHVRPYPEIPEEERHLAEDLLFDRRRDAYDPLAAFIAHFADRAPESATAVDPTADMTPEEALHWKIVHRQKEGIEDLVDRAVARRGPLAVLNEVLLPAMKEVGDKFGAGELILPFVLQSAEVMKRAVARLERYLERVEGQSKGRVVLATVYGDVHDIGKNLVHTILSNNGYEVVDLGKQVPVETIIAKALEVNADAIGLSALLVSTSRQMPLCAQELYRRGLRIPLLVGGAAINPSFVRAAAVVDEERRVYYPGGMFYCKDAFDGLAVLERLRDEADRDAFLRTYYEELQRRDALYEERRQQAAARRTPPRTAEIPPADVPTPPFWGVKVLPTIPLEEVVECLDRNALFRMQWGGRNLEGEAWQRLREREFEPRLRRYLRQARVGGWLRPRAVYGYFPCGRDGDALVVFDPVDRRRELGRFDFPRQPDRERLCLADYFRPLGPEGPVDVVALQVVTSGDAAATVVARLQAEGKFTEAYYVHGFAVQVAEATAEWLNRRIRRELGLEEPRGLRYSWGYPACPDLAQHRILFQILPVESTIGVRLTVADQLDPEQSTAALVVHHPAAKYFRAEPARVG